MSADMNKTVWIIAGPTASGKSRLALDLARACNGAVINADSMQVYKEIPILSAQPSSYDVKDAPHLLYGFHPIMRHFSSAQWALRAKDAIERMQAERKQPILVGGSGLYLRALIEGFAAMPVVPDTIRKSVTDLYDMLGPQGFYDTLAEIDPASAARLHPTDRQRCIRAREIYEVSGRPLSLWLAQPKQNIAPDLKYRSIVLLPDKAWLNEVIDRRFAEMVEHGAIEEARAVHMLNPPHDLTGTRALGLQALRDFLDGRMTLGEATASGQSQSRQFAKRQYTWFRHQELPHSLVLEKAEDDGLASARKHLLNE